MLLSDFGVTTKKHLYRASLAAGLVINSSVDAYCVTWQQFTVIYDIHDLKASSKLAVSLCSKGSMLVRSR